MKSVIFIKEATLRWNVAFEAAGFSNAIEVRRCQPRHGRLGLPEISGTTYCDAPTSSPQPTLRRLRSAVFTKGPRTGQISGRRYHAGIQLPARCRCQRKSYWPTMPASFLNMGITTLREGHEAWSDLQRRTISCNSTISFGYAAARANGIC